MKYFTKTVFVLTFTALLTTAREPMKIRPKQCTSPDGSLGTCMFVWECIKTEGRHLGTCVDGFLFGSCCAHNEGVNSIDGYNKPGNRPSSSSLSSSSSSSSSLSLSRTTPRPPKPPKPTPSTTTTTTTTPKPKTTTTMTPSTTTTTTTTTPKPQTVKPTSLIVTKPEIVISQNNKPIKPEVVNKNKPTIITASGPHHFQHHHKPSKYPIVSIKPASSSNNNKPSHFPMFGTNTFTNQLKPSQSAFNPTLPAWGPGKNPPFPISLIASLLSPPVPVTSGPPSTTTTTTTSTTTSTSAPTEAVTSGSNSSSLEPEVERQNSTDRAPTTLPKKCGLNKMKANPKVVGGKNSAFGAWPWQVSVRRTSFYGLTSTHRCGGALLNNQWIATAGHCVDDLLLTQIRIRVGEYDFSTAHEPLSHIETKAKKKIVHPKYNFFSYENDLALVQLEEPIEFQSHVSPICLPPDEADLLGKYATVTGWGRLSEGGVLPSVLQEVRVPIIDNDKCRNMFVSAGRNETIPDIFMCAGYDDGGRDSCQGDSGGPLQVQGDDGHWFLAGIISWGIGCGEPSLPGVCTRITKFKHWILSYIGTEL